MGIQKAGENSKGGGWGWNGRIVKENKEKIENEKEMKNRLIGRENGTTSL